MYHQYYNPAQQPAAQYGGHTYYIYPPQNGYSYTYITPPPTPSPPRTPERKASLKKEKRWSSPGQLAREYYESPAGYTPYTMPQTVPIHQARRVLWMADFMRAPISPKCPTLHAVLAEDTTLVNFDVRVAPKQAINPQAFSRFRGDPATVRPTNHLRLISYEFPWSIDIDYRSDTQAGNKRNVTCGDVWNALQVALSCELSSSEWTTVATSKSSDQVERKRVMEKILAARPYEQGKYPRRFDWLGRKVVFRGLAKDDSFSRKVLIPGKEPCAETWVVKLESSSST